jgi:hypothetical protein
MSFMVPKPSQFFVQMKLTNSQPHRPPPGRFKKVFRNATTSSTWYAAQLSSPLSAVPRSLSHNSTKLDRSSYAPASYRQSTTTKGRTFSYTRVWYHKAEELYQEKKEQSRCYFNRRSTGKRSVGVKVALCHKALYCSTVVRSGAFFL